jgi:selenide,water dikinase
MVAIGEARPHQLVTNAGAKPGDVLVLTKPIGTGILATALKRDLLTEQDLAPAVAAMTTLNAGAARAMTAVGVHAATDVTGFGLLGHLHSLLVASRAAAEVAVRAVPVLPDARRLAERGAIPGGTERNRASLADSVTFEAGVADVDRVLLADAQTSGGLLIAVAPERTGALVAALGREQAPVAAVIGRVVAGAAGRIAVTAGG